MIRSLLHLHILLSAAVSGAVTLVKGEKNYHKGIMNPTYSGYASEIKFFNADKIDTVDNHGEFSFWSNAFITIKPGEYIKFPSKVTISHLSDFSTVDNTYFVSSYFRGDETTAQLYSIPKRDGVFVCFRGYTRDSKFFGEVSLRKPNRGYVREKVIEKVFDNSTPMFRSNSYGGMETSWAIDQNSKFKLYFNNEIAIDITPDNFSAITSCRWKESKGSLSLIYNSNGMTITDTFQLI